MSPAGDSWGSEATPQTATALDRPETLLHLSFEPLKPVAVVLPPEESHGFFAQRTLATPQSRGNRILLILARTTISSHFASPPSTHLPTGLSEPRCLKCRSRG